MSDPGQPATSTTIHTSDIAGPSDRHPRTRVVMTYGGKGFVAACVFFATVRLASYLLQESRGNVSAPMALVALLIAVMALLLVGAAAHELLYWRRPMKALAGLLGEIAAGRMPMEELKRLERGPAHLSEPLQAIFRQLKEAKSEIQQVNLEIKERVATRTDALERKLSVLKVKAARDALTGLFNRRALEEELPRMVEECRDDHRSLVLLMIDIDHFKVLNDTLGHQAGDDLLRSFGQIIRSTLRETDAAYRYGGDEFVLLLPDADHASATALAKRLAQMVEGLAKSMRQLANKPKLTVGMSMLDELPATAEAEQLITKADERLYAIKHARPASQKRVA